MAAYPFASATPSAHVARHLSSLSTASSVPSFISHEQQQYQNDPQARQYAARALEAEVRQQGVYQGYAPPTHWAPSDYTAPADPYGQYSYGSDQSHGYVAPQQQQGQYPQSAQVSDFHGQNQSSQYQYSSQQYASSTPYPRDHQASVQRSSSQHQSPSHVQSNLKPQSHSYSQQQYPAQSSRTSLAPSASAPTGGHNSYHHSYGTHQQQRSQPAHPSSVPNSYGSQPTTSSYPSQAPTVSSYSQPASSATSYPTQPNSHTRPAPSDPISSSFLAPLASHQFAPRLSQPVSTLPRHSSDAQVRYSTNGERSYSMDSDGYSAGASSSSGNPYPANIGSSYGAAPPSRTSNHVQHSVSLGQRQRPSVPEQGLGLGYAPHLGQAAGGYVGQAQVHSRSGHQPPQPQATYSSQTWAGEQGQQPNQTHGAYHPGQQPNQRTGGHQNYASGDQASLSGGYQGQGGYQVQSLTGLGASNFFQQQAQARRPQLDQSYLQAPKNAYAQSGRVLQRPSQDSYPQQGQDQYAQAGRTYSQSQSQAWQTPAQDFSRAQQQQEPQPQSAASTSQHAQPSYSGTSQNQVQVQAQTQPPPTQPRVEQQVAQLTQVHPSNSPRTQLVAHSQDQPSSQMYPQPSHAQLQSQAPPQPAQSQSLSQVPPPSAQTQAQARPQGIYAPLAGRAIRGRGIGRQLQNGPQRVLQGGPPRILTPPQPPQSQVQQTQRWAQNAPIRQAQQVGSGQQPIGSQPPPTETVANRQEPGGDTSMEYVGPTQPASTNEHSSAIPDADATYPDSPPPPYEPLMRERVKKPQDGTTQGQEVNGYAAQLQQLSLRSQAPTPQPPATLNAPQAEDTLDPEAAAESGGPTEWFSAHTSDWSAPLLAPTVISRLTQQAARRGIRLSEVDTSNLVRILRILGRSVAKGEDLDPFGSLLGGAGASNTAKAKVKGKKKGKGPMEEEVEGEEPKEEVELSEDDFLKLASALETAKEAVIAADCVFAILSAEKLPKQLYSEDLITSCLAAVKNQLSNIIYPYVETASDVHGHSPQLLLHVAQSTSSSAVDHRNLLGEIFRALNAVLPRITALANRGISETMVIQAAFIGIGPFFVVEVTNEKSSKASGGDKKNGGRIQVLDALGGSTSMRGLRLTALGLVRALFASYESQRAWIVEEILGSLIKLPDMKLKAGQFKLRDGATIHVVSALLFQLVQTSAHDVRIHAQKLARKRREAIADAKTSSLVENGKAPLLDEHDREEVHLYLNGLESATKTAKTIVLFLTQRTGKNKNTKSSNEAEYRSIFDNLIQDILVVINWPEWPAANLLMGIVCKFMLSSLEDVKSSSDSAAKNMALDHLGEIATRLRETHLTLQLPFETTVKPLDEIVASCDLKALDDLIIAHSDVYAHLSKRSSDDQAYDSARELTAATWAQELATCLRQCDSILSKVEDDEDMEGSNDANLPELANRIKAALRNVWKEGVNDMFEAGTDTAVKRVDDLAERFGGTQSLRNAFEPILGAILMSLDAPAVFMRTKALRALGLIVTKDSSILKQSNVRRAIESHLMDSSPAVRDAAVELIGKYLVLSPELVDDYYPQIANRIADTGLAVRKRVIKLLKSLYSLTDNVARRVDICTKLVLRMLDEDDGIKDLSISSIEELWFSDGNETNTNRRGTARENGANSSAYMTNKISVIMGVNANFRDRHSPLEDMLHEIIARKGDKDAGSIVQRYVDVCDALTDTLVDAQEIPGFSVVNCIRTVHVFTAAHPTVMSTRKAVVLLPYLKSGATADDQAIADYLLKIFRSCIPRMPAGTSKFGTELQQTLEPMVIKPSGAAGVAALPETVACLCAVVHHITHDYQRLVALLRSCNARLVQVLAKQNQPSPQEISTLSILALIVSLLGEHSDFDKIREEQPTLKPSIDAIKQTSIAEYIYGLIHQLYRRFNDQLLRGRLLQCFGFLFRAHPSLLTHDDSAEMMDAIFASPQEEAQARLLKIMQDFLLSEASKHSHAANNKPKKGGAVNMDELIGNTDGFADSGVSSAIIQRYLTQILSSALSPNRYIQTPAVDILSFTVRQGLAHPLQCFPIIVALETSHDNSLSARASNLHTLLHNKHASLLNSRYLESVGRSLEYQKQLQPGSWKGYRLSPHPTALLHRWYSLVREKRQPKLDFLKSFLRAFDVDVAVLSCSQEHLDLVRYIAENVSAFDYKTQEEILTVIRHLTHVLSVAGMHIVEILSQEQRKREESGTAMEVDGAATATPAPSDGLARARVATTISIILVLKSHLKHLYGITEEKASRWVPGKKSAVGDKPAVARNDKPIAWDRVAFAMRVGRTAEDVRAQEEQLLELWAEDGVTAEPDEFGE
ncbi:Sister chromatid cohesion protein 2 [Ceratobasidium sp. UAMH 11750]|nr:Sister chromatid cohesion protein 2 [Ceratobasidium sp. UAMH 11750]